MAKLKPIFEKVVIPETKAPPLVKIELKSHHREPK